MRDGADGDTLHPMGLRRCSIADLKGGKPTVTSRHCMRSILAYFCLRFVDMDQNNSIATASADDFLNNADSRADAKRVSDYSCFTLKSASRRSSRRNGFGKVPMNPAAR